MSNITDVILIFSTLEGQTIDCQEVVMAIDRINAWLKENDHRPLVRVDSDSVQGDKVFMDYVFMGAFNCLARDAFVQVVGSQFWVEPENVYLMIRNEDDEGYTIHRRGPYKVTFPMRSDS